MGTVFRLASAVRLLQRIVYRPVSAENLVVFNLIGYGCVT